MSALKRLQYVDSVSGTATAVDLSPCRGDTHLGNNVVVISGMALATAATVNFGTVQVCFERASHGGEQGVTAA